MSADPEKARELVYQLSRVLEKTRKEETEQAAIIQEKICTQEDMTQALKEKIRALEKQLQQYLEHAPEKEARARELQERINEQTLNKQQQKTYLRQRLKQLKDVMTKKEYLLKEE